ncbi:helix-turn-helix transcriptional regulator [Bradyrhizobium sp. Arg314]
MAQSLTNTDEFLQNLSRGSRFVVQRTEDSDVSGEYRVLPPNEYASGHVMGYYDARNPSLTIRNVEARYGFSDDEPGLGRLVFLLHLAGSRCIELGGVHRVELNGPTLGVYYQPRGVGKRSTWIRGTNETSLTVGIWPETLSEIFGFYPGCLPDFSSTGAARGEAFLYSRPLPFTLMSAAEQLLHPRIHPILARNYIATKSSELLYLSLSTLLTDHEQVSRPGTALDRVQQVKTLVDASLRNPPSLTELAARVGVSAQELSNELRAETRVGYAQYVTDRRMKRARLLLEGGDTPLKQVAFEVGYGHTSNFCASFKRHFGMTPKHAR